jgi:hypothetical protein
VGYLWRYIGNGGGMGLAFYAVYPIVKDKIKPIHAGVAYGVAIFCCLLVTIYFSPSGRTYLFNPSVMTGLIGLMGHVVFGFTLGYGAKRFPDRDARVPSAAAGPRQGLLQSLQKDSPLM